MSGYGSYYYKLINYCVVKYFWFRGVGIVKYFYSILYDRKLKFMNMFRN